MLGGQLIQTLAIPRLKERYKSYYFGRLPAMACIAAVKPIDATAASGLQCKEIPGQQ
jgi:hypothetical protein